MEKLLLSFNDPARVTFAEALKTLEGEKTLLADIGIEAAAKELLDTSRQAGISEVISAMEKEIYSAKDIPKRALDSREGAMKSAGKWDQFYTIGSEPNAGVNICIFYK